MSNWLCCSGESGVELSCSATAEDPGPALERQLGAPPWTPPWTRVRHLPLYCWRMLRPVSAKARGTPNIYGLSLTCLLTTAGVIIFNHWLYRRKEIKTEGCMLGYFFNLQICVGGIKSQKRLETNYKCARAKINRLKCGWANCLYSRQTETEVGSRQTWQLSVK